MHNSATSGSKQCLLMIRNLRRQIALTKKTRYKPSLNFGGVGRDRTADTRIFSPLLYRLSYRTGPFRIENFRLSIPIRGSKNRAFSYLFVDKLWKYFAKRKRARNEIKSSNTSLYNPKLSDRKIEKERWPYSFSPFPLLSLSLVTVHTQKLNPHNLQLLPIVIAIG